MPASSAHPALGPPHRVRSDVPFFSSFIVLSGCYVGMIALMLLAMAIFSSPAHFADALGSEEIRFSIQLSLISCTLSAVLSLCVAVPVGYLMSRYQFRGRNFVDALLDVPIVLPPLVIGLALLILFSLRIGPFQLERFLNERLGTAVSFNWPAVVLAQFMVACAFAVRTMRVTFDQIDRRHEQVALTLGCNHGEAFWRVVLPEAGRGMVTAGTLAWARSLGEFGPILVFAGATRMRTEVLPTTVFLELSVGNIEAAVSVSLIMVGLALVVLILARLFGLRAAMR